MYRHYLAEKLISLTTVFLREFQHAVKLMSFNWKKENRRKLINNSKTSGPPWRKKELLKTRRRKIMMSNDLKF